MWYKNINKTIHWAIGCENTFEKNVSVILESKWQRNQTENFQQI